MAKIRVKCPACNTELEIDSEFAGQEVECGNCLEVFVANPPGKKSGESRAGTTGSSSKSGSSSRGKSRDDEDEDRPKKRARSRRRDDDDDDDEHDRRRRRDDDEDDDYYSPPPSRRGGGGNGLAIASLILGITAVFPGCCCGLLGIPLSLGAIVTGSIALKNPEGKPMAIIGICLGALMIGFTILGIVFNIGMMGMNNGRFR
jgi:predicted Zn finger-like uncharacterized protein